jgi:signal transduction histidine kinase
MADERALLERERLASLATRISHILTEQQSLPVILQQCAEHIVSSLDMVFARMWLLDDQAQTLILKASAGLYTNLHGRYSRVPIRTSLKIGQIVVDRCPRLTNTLQEEVWVNEPDWAKREGLVAFAGYPLIAQDRVVGVMAMFSRRALSERTLDELAAISGGIAQCVVRSQAEEALRRSEERLSLTVEGAGIGFWDWDVETGEMVWSDRFYSLLGYEPGTIRPTFHAWKERIHPEDVQRVTVVLEKSRENRTLYTCDYRLCPSDRPTPRWVAGRGHFLYDESGAAVRMIGAVSEIGHRKQAEAEIRRLLEEAQRREELLREKQAQLVQTAKLASIGRLTTGVAHELNNPLNNIGLFVANALDTLIATTPESREQAISDLELAQEQLKRAAEVVSHLRIFGRAPEQLYHPVPINEVVVATFRFLREHLRLAGVEGRYHLAAENPLVHGSRIQLEQILVNMMSNAADAMKQTDARLLTVTTRATLDVVEIAIQDTGVGIPAQVLPNIFDPFFTTKEVGEGTGLGLSIVYGIVKEHHGDITVQSRFGSGTEFKIVLPIVPQTL